MFEQRSGVRPGDSVRRKSSLEERLEVRGGVSAYRGPFPLHYLDAVVAPNIPHETSHCGRCRRLRFESMDLPEASPRPRFARMKKRPRDAPYGVDPRRGA
jgi:hypothetical protein